MGCVHGLALHLGLWRLRPAREVEFAGLSPGLAATVTGSGSTMLQLLLEGRPWEYRTRLVTYTVAETLQTLVEYGGQRQLHDDWGLYAFAVVLQLSAHFTLRTSPSRILQSSLAAIPQPGSLWVLTRVNGPPRTL